MFRSTIAVICNVFLLSLSGCAGFQNIAGDVGDAVFVNKIDTTEAFGGLSNVDTYAKCAAADVATTTIGLATRHMHEINPLTKALYIKAFGHVMGTVIPVIGMSIAGYYILRWINKPAVTATVAGATCFTAVHNLYVSQYW